jgi:hypothetical protein
LSDFDIHNVSFVHTDSDTENDCEPHDETDTCYALDAQQTQANEVNTDEGANADPLIVHLKETRAKYGKNLIFSHVNINSLKKCKEYMLDLLSLKYVDVLCITESKLSDCDVDNEYKHSDYKLYRQDRSSNSGGMVVWFRNDIPHKRRHDLEFTDYDPHIESMVFNITVKKQTWYLIVVYKNPKVSDNVFLQKPSNAYNQMISDGKEIILLGDVNIDMQTLNDKLSTQLCHTFGLQNLITRPTCFKTSAGTLLDPVIVMNPRRFQTPINVHCGYSDFHNMVGCITKLEIPPQQPRTIQYRLRMLMTNTGACQSCSPR